MKIAPINFSGNYKFNRISKNETWNNNYQTNTVNDNKFADLIGRSQVKQLSFKGLALVGDDPDIVKVEIRGNDTVKRTEYNKITGAYSSTISDYDGNVKISENYNPLTSTSTTIIHKEDGTKVETTQTGDSYSHTEIDKYNRVIYTFTRENEDYSYSARNDFENNRQIISIFDRGYVENKVINLLTGEEITEGELIYDEKFDEERNCYVKTNLLTYKKESEEWKLPNGKTQILLGYYSESTGRLGYKKTYNALTKDYDEEYYREDGTREQTVFSTKNKNVKRIKEYAPDGETILRDIERQKDDYGKVEYIRDFIPDTDILVKETHFDDYGKGISYFNQDTGIKEKEEYYMTSYSSGQEFLYKLTEYYTDGMIPKETVYYRTDKKVKLKELYRENGTLKEVSEFDKNGRIKNITTYRRDGIKKEKAICAEIVIRNFSRYSALNMRRK